MVYFKALRLIIGVLRASRCQIWTLKGKKIKLKFQQKTTFRSSR